MPKLTRGNIYQAGFSLIEIMVGLVLGLLATLAITSAFSVFEGQKRSTSGSADAQTNGTIALMNMQRHVQMAGYGLPMPMADIDNNALKCADTSIFPVEITDGGGINSDQVTVRYSTTAVGAVPVSIVSSTGSGTAADITVTNNIGCGSEDANYATTYASGSNLVMLVKAATSPVCSFATIDGQPTAATATGVSQLKLTDVSVSGALTDYKVACIGNWQDYTFTVDTATNTLRLNNQPIVSGVVKLEAEYGIASSADSNDVASTSWVKTISVAERNKIKAVRLVIVLTDGLKEKEDMAIPKIWRDSGNGVTATPINVTGVTDYKKYRYRVFDTTIPLRNMIWSKGAL